uniref:Uncharacterized protein n=1 Tax=Romanomermis culicivorax TaxID=13658 RepID=A0A915HSJ0_ROMCU
MAPIQFYYQTQKTTTSDTLRLLQGNTSPRFAFSGSLFTLDLQRILEEDKANFGAQRSHSLKNKSAAVWPKNATVVGTSYCPGTIKNSMSLDNILRENQSLHETVDDLKHKLEAVSTSSLAPDQYVTMQRYRLLKAKSKKLLHDKCEALRTALLERDSVQVKMQLQDKELSELRSGVYEHKCVCKDETNKEQLKRLHSEMLQLCKVSAQTSSCLLDVCKDISNKRCPDYDQILGLKGRYFGQFDLFRVNCSSFFIVNDDALKRTFRALGGSSNSLNCSNLQNMDQSVTAEQLLSLQKSTIQNLNQMQKLMVDYYTNELVDSIDCRLHPYREGGSPRALSYFAARYRALDFALLKQCVIARLDKCELWINRES